jgi:hypothetical protein
VSDGNDADTLNNVIGFLNKHTNSQTKSDSTSWTPVVETFGALNSDGVALAPSPGLGYGEYYLSMRKYTRKSRKIQQRQQAKLRGCRAQPTYLGFCAESATDIPDCQPGISAYVLAQCSSTGIEPRSKRSKTCHDRDVGQISRTPQPQNIYRSVDCGTFPLETLVLIFHPCTQLLPLHDTYYH